MNISDDKFLKKLRTLFEDHDADGDDMIRIFVASLVKIADVPVDYPDATPGCVMDEILDHLACQYQSQIVERFN